MDMLLRIGDEIQFGHYPQGAQGQILPIEWRVLDMREDRALLLAQRILDVQPFAGEDGGVFWGHSRLRGWLQDDFMPRAFSPAEMERLYQPEQREYQDGDMLLWQLFGMEDAVECVHEAVFVLSQADVLRYFPGQNTMFCPGASARPTQWVRGQQGADDLCWWLRSSSAESGIVYIVSPVDSVGAAWDARETCHGVRPALWLRLDDSATA